MRPVGRAKRQEVWLYLSSVDFTAWSRVDLTTAEFQRQIEGLFIQFMQRNRSFFGQQGRRRMSDVRALISACAATVAQGLLNHLTGQRQGKSPFGSPRPTVSWSATPISGQPRSPLGANCCIDDGPSTAVARTAWRTQGCISRPRAF